MAREPVRDKVGHKKGDTRKSEWYNKVSGDTCRNCKGAGCASCGGFGKD